MRERERESVCVIERERDIVCVRERGNKRLCVYVKEIFESIKIF